jgi:hydroxymethylbilane synthase
MPPQDQPRADDRLLRMQDSLTRLWEDQLAGTLSAGRVQRHHRTLPLRVGTRGSPLALVQTRAFMALLTHVCPVLRAPDVFQEHIIATTGDHVQDRKLVDLGGKGLFAKEIHEALLDRRVDFAVHSLKDLETSLPPGIVLACTLQREDARDALILGGQCGEATDEDPYACLPRHALIGTCSVRRQAQLMYARRDLRVTLLRGNVQSRLSKLRAGQCDASLLAIAGLNRLDMAHEANVLLDPEVMVPAASQGVVGITVREDDADLRALLMLIEDAAARTAATAERAMLAHLDGSCRTPIGGYSRLLDDGQMLLTGMIARADGSFMLKRQLLGAQSDAAHLGAALGETLRRESPADVLA